MAMDLTVTGLIDDVKRTGGFPDGLFSDDDYLAFANDAMSNTLIPFLMRHREDYFMTYTDFLAADVIAIPEDAIAQKLKDVVLVDASNNMINVPRLSIEEISAGRYETISPIGFYLEDNNIKFYPANKITNTIRIYYFKRPNYLILNEDCAKIVTITGAAATVNAVPTGWTTATEIDVVSNLHPFAVTTTYTISSIADPVINLSASGAVANQYICPKGYTVYPKIPIEIRDILTKSTVEAGLLAIKDVAGLKAIKEDIKELIDDLSTLITPRVDGECKKIVNVSGIFPQSRSNSFRRY